MAAAAAGFTTRSVKADDLGLRVGFQPLPFASDKTGGDQVLFYHATDSGQHRRDVLAPHPGPAARVKDGLQLFDDKGHIATAPEHGGNHACERDGPGKMLHVF